MTRRVCLSIGVSTVEPVPGGAATFAYLDGAVLAARALGTWALHAGFGDANVRVVDDGFVNGLNNPVTEERVRNTVEELFPPGAEVVQLLLLAFRGHGCTDANLGSISWLFTDSLQQRYRVHSVNFYNELHLFGVRRITVITDACREAPRSLDLLRLEPRRVLTAHGLPLASPRSDLLAACQDGQLGYMVLGDGPVARGKCVFSGVIADALWGREESAIERGAITTTTLARCVRERTAERALEYGLTLNPQCLPDVEPAILHDSAQLFPAADILQAWPPVVRARGGELLGRVPDIGIRLPPSDVSIEPATLIELGDAQRTWPPDETHEQSPGRPTWLSTRLHRLRTLALQSIGREPSSPAHRDSANLVVRGTHAIWSQDPVTSIERGPDHFLFDTGASASTRTVMAQFNDGVFTPVVLYPHWTVSVGRGADGSVYQAYRKPGRYDDYAHAVQMVAAFSNGKLDLGRLQDLVENLWTDGKPDPVISVLCAYLYRTLADYDSIRRLAYFHVSREQAVPFDIALLGAMKVSFDRKLGMQVHIPPLLYGDLRRAGVNLPYDVRQATPAMTAAIGGRCPWLGMGWDYVLEAKDEWRVLVEGLAEFSDSVPRSGFTRLAYDWGVTMATQLALTKNVSDNPEQAVLRSM